MEEEARGAAPKETEPTRGALRRRPREPTQSLDAERRERLTVDMVLPVRGHGKRNWVGELRRDKEE